MPRVEAWSVERLPFGRNEGWLVSFRAELRARLRELRSARGQVLHAVYDSAQPDFCDAENVLFYNVGEGSFGHLAEDGLRFERRFIEPRAPECEPNLEAAHYHAYTSADRNGEFAGWRKTRTLVRWDLAECRAPRLTPATVWHALRTSRGEMGRKRSLGDEGFGLTVTVAGGWRRLRNPARLLKKVFDGVICAAHAHDGAQLEEVSARLARELGENPEGVSQLLTGRDQAALGLRPLVCCRSAGVQWNPGDDRCVAGEIFFQSEAAPSPWKLSTDLYRVERSH